MGWWSSLTAPWPPSLPSSPASTSGTGTATCPWSCGPIGLQCRSPVTARRLPSCSGRSSGHQWSSGPRRAEITGGAAMDYFRRLRDRLLVVHKLHPPGSCCLRGEAEEGLDYVCSSSRRRRSHFFSLSFPLSPSFALLFVLSCPVYSILKRLSLHCCPTKKLWN